MPKVNTTIQQSLDSLLSAISDDTPWVQCSLGELFDQAQYGLSIAGSSEGTYPILRMNNLQNGTVLFNDLQYISIDEGLFEQYRLKHGDLLFNRTNAPNIVGKTSIFECDGDFTFASYLIRISLNRERVSPRFFNYFMNWHETQKQLKCVSSKGVGQSNINLSNLKRLSISLPPFLEQQRIATILATVDEAIAVTDQIITQVQQFKNELLNRVFSQSWPLVKIDDIKADRRNAISLGPFGSDLVSKDYVESGVPVLRGKNLSSLKINFDNLVFVTEEKADQLRSSNVFANDIIITYRGTLGQVSLLSKPLPWPRCVISQSLMKVSCNEQVALPEYILQYLISSKGQQQILGCKGHTGVPALGNPVTSIKQFQIPLPPLAQQQQIAHLLSTVDDRLALERAERDRLVALKKALMQVLLTGTVRVPPGVAEEVAPAHA